MSELATKTITCSERVKMNAIVGLLFILAGDGLVLVAVLSDRPGTAGMYLTTACGIAGILLGFYYLLCFLNKAISVSGQGVVFRNWMGKTRKYTWDEVEVSFHSGRNAYFTFVLAGKKVTFYGYAKNAQALYDYLFENERFDRDTMESERKAKQCKEESIREMQRKAREHEEALEAEFDDED